MPFGQVRNSIGIITQTDFGYTGQRNEAYTDLMDYRSRWYDGDLGRFVSPDSIIPNAANPQNLNRYSYVQNSPIIFNDPSGHKEACGIAGEDDCGPHKPSPKPDPKPVIPGKGPKRHGGEADDFYSSVDQCIPNSKYSSCGPFYFSGSLGLDAPTIMMLAGLGISTIAPEVGVPLGLTGAVIEACAYTATPLCAAVKLLSVSISGTIDTNGNIYAGPQFSWGKSILPFVSVSDYFGGITEGPGMVPAHNVTEAQMRDTLSGFSVSAGTIATGGISYSPFSSTYKNTYYLDGFPEVGALNINYNFWIYDITP